MRHCRGRIGLVGTKRQRPTAGFATSSLTETAIPEIRTVITHLRDVRGGQTYESLAR